MKNIYVLAAACMLALAGPGLAFADHSSGEEAEQQEEVTMHATASADCTFTTHLGVGSRGDDVTCLQTTLIKSGALDTIDAPTGYFGDLTAAAVQKWQTANVVPSTGYFGSLSHAALGNEPAEAHAHEPIDVSTWDEVPEVSIELHKDAMAGYNLEVAIEHFTFAPEHVNGEVKENEGHAHIYVNGEKYARLYGTWMHLPGNLFHEGENEVRVTLNANDHSDLANGDDLIEASEHVHID